MFEKQDKLHPRDKAYLWNITESEGKPLKDSSTATVANPKVASFSDAMLATFCHCGYFTHVVWQPLRAMPCSSD